jgi:hypothetical protein
LDLEGVRDQVKLFLLDLIGELKEAPVENKADEGRYIDIQA